jgi:hypothetical protein
MSMSANRNWQTLAFKGAALLGLAAATGCTTGVISGIDTKGGSAAGTSQNPGPAGAGGGASSVANAVIDPGRVAIHRLNNNEYDNTVRDLLGTTTQPAAQFLAEDGLNFDNTATALGMTTAQYQGYFDAATALVTEALASATERASFMTCTPTAADDPCARQILTSFGMQIYRRPLETAEVDRAMKLYDADIARAQTGTEAIGQALRGMLSAANFLYRIEHDDNPTSVTPHPLSSYELASRLSYLTWSSMPDAALFSAAKANTLQDPAALETTVDRLLADPKVSAFVESFSGQWLGVRDLITHAVTPEIFPSYTSTLADAMMAEGNLWFQEFLTQNLPLNTWFSADFNYVNDELAKHYGMPVPGSGTKMVRTVVTTDQRQGFLGLATFLTVSSVPSRTSPTTRGKWVLTALLCAPPAPPPPGIAPLDPVADPNATPDPALAAMQAAENVKDQLAMHRASPACAACHNSLDPIGLGLEQFDGIGRYRDKYGNGDVIDPQGQLPDGTTFAGAAQLGPLIGKDPRFNACVQSKMFAYALGRDIEAYDAGETQQLAQKWAARGFTFRNLMKEVVLSDSFRLRRGEAQ